MCIILLQKHPNLRANLCRALGKCCSSGINARRFSCKQIVDQLYKYMRSEHKIVRENLPLALSGLSEDPLNCIKIEALGFLSVSLDLFIIFLQIFVNIML